ncbi:MAG: hypothetical protein KI785_04905, partial [Devosiaceae bacterium]|nr:hypothetical protein [Devosiaceae bacterium MH13]
PQGLDALIEELSVLAEEPETTPASAPPPLPPTSNPKAGNATPPPLAEREANAPPPLPQRGSVPTAGRRKTSTIGEAPPAAKPRRRLPLTRILSFIVALAVAWIVSSGGLGLFNDDEGAEVQAPQQQTQRQQAPSVDSAPPDRPANVPDQPRKGPAATEPQLDNAGVTVEPLPEGVAEQVCFSALVFQEERAAGVDALLRYIAQCAPHDGQFVEAARQELGR